MRYNELITIPNNEYALCFFFQLTSVVELFISLSIDFDMKSHAPMYRNVLIVHLHCSHMNVKNYSTRI